MEDKKTKAKNALMIDPRTINLTGFVLSIISAIAVILSGPLYQLDILSLTDSFGLLRFSLTFGLGLSTIVCFLGLIYGIISFKKDFFIHSRHSIIGIALALVLVALPASYLSRGAPPIHEITTDFDNPPSFIDLLPLREEDNAANPPEYKQIIEGFGLKIDVIAKQQEHYPEISPLIINKANYEDIFEHAINSAKELGWTLVSQNPKLGRIEAYDKTLWFGFTDDISIRITEIPMAYKIDLRSKSRVGFGDFGINAERINFFIEKMKKLVKS